ncbi:hypothetical protein Acr_15g0015210 [Actinidia rufa]|uniref:Protein kinase domain-containing protein n=1 Tax=Actinidia rufa TaxID=165716 RepID=A0A7J0FW38_9ERIC|nr:hypothetical protein Acr_15g0015210 [Actinidia rufa]
MVSLGQSSRSTLAEDNECVASSAKFDNSDEDIDVLMRNEANEDFDDDGHEDLNIGEALHDTPHIPFFTNLIGIDDVVGGRNLYDRCPTWLDITPEFAKVMVFKDKDAVIRAFRLFSKRTWDKTELPLIQSFVRSKTNGYTIYPGPSSPTTSPVQSSPEAISPETLCPVRQTNEAYVLMEDPGWKIASIVENVKNNSGFIVSYKKVWLGRTKAIAMIFEDWDASYEKLPKFMRTLELRNPGIDVILATLDLEGPAPRREPRRPGRPGGLGGRFLEQCCRDALMELSKALAQQTRFGINHTLFINQDQWVNCSSSFLDHHQPSVSADSCQFTRLFNGSSKCSSISLPSMEKKPSYQHALNECARFNESSSFNDECTNCTLAIIKTRDILLEQFKAKTENHEKAICTVAVVTSAAAGILDDPLSVDAFYRCLHALGVFASLAKAILAILLATIGMMLVITLIKYVPKKMNGEHKRVQTKDTATCSGLYQFSKAEIENAINFGNERKFLGRGSAGQVYQGVLPSGQAVAIKQIYRTNTSNSFKREVDGLSRVRHPNLVSLFGCCMEDGEQYLVYEYCSAGNLAQHLLTADMEESKVFTDIRGTIGYMDPEYMTNAKLTCASDVYSLGIVALQLLSGQKVIELDLDARDQLTTKAKDVSMGKRPLTDFVDPLLNGNINSIDFESILQIAVLCVAKSSKGRPSMDVLFDEMENSWKNTQAEMQRFKSTGMINSFGNSMIQII